MDPACQLSAVTRHLATDGRATARRRRDVPGATGVLWRSIQVVSVRTLDRHRRAACADLLATERPGFGPQFSIGSAVVDQPSLVMVTT